jgi:DNA-binding NarL/FixJ family response regulator
MIQAMGGAIEVSSTHGVGSTFTIELAAASAPSLGPLPDIGGEEVLKHLKASPDTQAIPVIMLTADASSSLSRRLRALGASELFSKPVDVPRFLRVIGAPFDRG